MSIKRDEAIHSINEAKEKIISIKRKLEEKNNEIPKLEELIEQFKSIYCILGKKQKDLDKDTKDLGSIIDEITKKQVMLLNEKTEVMIATIRANLPKDMIIEPEGNNIMEGSLKYENESIGELKIIQELDRVTVYVKINNSEEYFLIEDELEMYKIINYIITQFNYPNSLK